ncbi:Beta-1 [Acropora cervicornis]|uniref:Beta-1 n=1 Tax=Acropora cervicornis TaxID=6130 RepID=A0AAD9VHT9_ACRCE|nr:Beta-1 [Acropora cervicornis]
MSVPRLLALLACYDPNEVTLLGERYGYGLTQGYGYEYITGGGRYFVIFLDFLLQAKPNEYAPSLLEHQTPVSFHKHTDLDPLSVYEKYLS